ncbi:MAG: GTP cyclohydrolase II [Chloroflexi bacterium]|nr:GTP cyclohydrolase II [Chloroflexota bacterium]
MSIKKLRLEASARLPTKFGIFNLTVYIENEQLYHLALVLGGTDWPDDHVLVRIHSKCVTGDALGSIRCDCQDQLVRSLQLISEAKQGVLVYLDQEGRGIGLLEKIKAYAMQDEFGLDTVDANIALGHPVDARSYEPAIEILHALGLNQIALLTNNPEKLQALQQAGFNVVQRTLEITPNEYNRKYLETKKLKLGHRILLSFEDSD